LENALIKYFIHQVSFTHLFQNAIFSGVFFFFLLQGRVSLAALFLIAITV